MQDKIWQCEDRVYLIRYGEKVYGSVIEVRMHPSGNPWVSIRFDSGDITSATQTTLISTGVVLEA